MGLHRNVRGDDDNITQPLKHRRGSEGTVPWIYIYIQLQLPVCDRSKLGYIFIYIYYYYHVRLATCLYMIL